MKTFSLLLLLFLLSFYSVIFADTEDSIYLTKLDQPIDQEWKHHKFVNETLYSLVVEEGKPAIKAEGQLSSSGLYKEINYSIKEYPWIKWEWKVEVVHKNANLRFEKDEDMALAIFIIFPHKFIPWMTKVLAYVWVGPNHKRGDIIEGKHSTYIVLRVGEKNKGKWISEVRNVYEDYRKIFGEYPDSNPENLALFTDNDQTLEPVRVFYGPIQVMKNHATSDQPK